MSDAQADEIVPMKYFDELALAEKVERWEHVESVLVNLPEHERTDHWDMSEWGRLTECGTVACAAGHCGLHPWFRERGFAMTVQKCDCMPDCTFSIASITRVEDFFGSMGSDMIFKNPTSRSVEAVIGEVRSYLKILRGEAA